MSIKYKDSNGNIEDVAGGLTADMAQTMIDDSIEAITPVSSVITPVIANKVMDSASYSFTASASGLLVVKGYKSTIGGTIWLSVHDTGVDNWPFWPPAFGTFILMGFVKAGDTVILTTDNTSDFSDWLICTINIVNMTF